MATWFRMTALALIALAAVSTTPAFGAFSTGKYRGKTNRSGSVKFRASAAKVTSFSITAPYRCTDGDRFRVTESGFASMKISNGRFSQSFTAYARAGRWRISGKLTGRDASGTFRGSRRYNRRNRLDRRGSVVCRTRRLKFKATGPALATPPPVFRPPSAGPGASGRVERSCSLLSGAGSFSNPLVIGTVTRNTLVRDCEPLTSGAGFNQTWFSFALASPAPPDALVASLFQLTPTAISAVHPRLASGAVTLITSTSGGVWLGDPNAPSGRALPVGGLSAGPYMLGMEKLDSPLRSLNTPPYHVAIALDPNSF